MLYHSCKFFCTDSGMSDVICRLEIEKKRPAIKFSHDSRALSCFQSSNFQETARPGFFLLRNVIFKFPDDLCRNAVHNAVVRHILCYDRARRNHHIIANGHAWQKGVIAPIHASFPMATGFLIPRCPRRLFSVSGWLTVAMSVFDPIIT